MVSSISVSEEHFDRAGRASAGLMCLGVRFDVLEALVSE